MTRIADFQKAVNTFKAQVTVPMRGTKGGTTWTQVQGLANSIPGVLVGPIGLIEKALKSNNPKDKDTITTWLTVMHREFGRIRLTSADKYISEHSVGGKKVRGTFSSAQAKRDEEKRVALAQTLKEQYGDLKEMLALLKKPQDLV